MVQHNTALAPETLSTQDDAVRICHQLAGYDFPWELNRSLELAVLRTFCVPRIATLLRATGEFTHRTQKRYDDTTLIIGNILKWGYDSPQGRAAIARMNAIHQRFDICNEDFLYVLSTLVCEPIRWNQRFGWRLFTVVEKQALYEFWAVVGQRMGIQNIPATLTDLEHFNQDYETQYFQYHPDNARVGEAVVQLMKGWFPAIAAPLIPLFVKALTDDLMCQALGWPPPQPVSTYWVLQGLKLRRYLAKWWPRRRHSRFITDQPNITYPQGYHIEQLGPPDASAPRSSSRCPFLKMRSLLKADL
jgi:hypothetical protein